MTPEVVITAEKSLLGRMEEKVNELYFTLAQHSQIGFVAYEFLFRFFNGRGPQKVTYTQGIPVEEMMTSPGVVKNVDIVIAEFKSGSMKVGDVHHFSYSFTPPNFWERFIHKGKKLNDLLASEPAEAHKDFVKSMSLVKLYVGSYTGTITVIDENTLEVVLYNRTTLNSLLLHIGTYLDYKGIMSEETFNNLFGGKYKVAPFVLWALRDWRARLIFMLIPTFRPTEQVFKFRINIDEWK